MTAIKAYQVEQFVQKNIMKSGTYLIYGNDAGLVHERSLQLTGTIDMMGKRIRNNDSEIVVLDMAELEADPSRLAVEALTTSMFGSSPAIRVRGGNSNLVPALKELLEKEQDATIVIEASNLAKRDRLRALLEESKNGWALPCFLDDRQSLEQLIKKSFAQNNISISPDAVSCLCSILGNDRDITRRELEKLHDFALQSKRIELADVQELCGDNSMITIDKILDAAGTGNVQDLESALDSAFAAGIDAQAILVAGSRHFMFLRSIRTKMDNGTSATQALSRTYPKPHFSRNHAIETQLRTWTQPALASSIKRLLDATLSSRKNSALAQTIARRAFLGICVAAARR